MNVVILKNLLHYNEHTGQFTWLERSRSMFKSDRDHLVWNRRYAGNIAGTVAHKKGNNSYSRIKINGVGYVTHRLAWLYVTGKLPEKNIDHINGDSLDNRFENLRDVSHATNSKNMRFRKNKSVGVYRDKRTGRYRAQIQVNYEYKYLGMFDTERAALDARLSAQEEYDFSKTHGAKHVGA